jgi:hypothetical protein
MALQTSGAKLKQILSGLHFANDGDAHERKYWVLFKERFPNCELFWRQFVAPMTRRIECPVDDPKRYERRGVSEELWAVGYLQYSLFLHLGYASDHLATPMPSSFCDFYSHLGSACDLVEDFLLQAYLLVLECRGLRSHVLQEMTREQFLQLAADWYDAHYAAVYQHYLSKGKGMPMKMPTRASMVGEYLAGQPAWSDYLRYAQRIREYRNVIIHDVLIGEVIMSGGIRLVPRKEKIQTYRKLSTVFAAAKDPARLKTDFLVMHEQMLTDFAGLQKHLNALWVKVIADFDALLFTEQNPELLKKYDIRFADV